MTISQKSLDFLLTNYVTNSRDWFNEHKNEYREFVVEPLAELVTKLTPGMLEIDSGFIIEPKIDKTISRIHRDMRIPQNRNKSRYRQNSWIVFIRDKKLYNGLPGFYFEIYPGGFGYGMGYYQASTASMKTMREMLLDEEPSAKKAVEAYEKQKIFTIEGEEYKRPRYLDAPKNLHPWLERKGLSLVHDSEDFDLLFSENLADVIMNNFKKIAPVYHFLIDVEARRIHKSV